MLEIATSSASRRRFGMFTVFLAPILCGTLLAWSFLPQPVAPWLAWIALVPLALAVADRRYTVAAYFGAYCGGLVFNLITTDLIRTLDGGVGLQGTRAPDWFAQAQLLALFWPLALLLARFAYRRCAVPMTFVLAAAWVVHEALLAHLWAAIDGTGWQAYRLGYALADFRLVAQTAAIGGVAALTFLAAGMSGAIWDLWNSRAQRWSSAARLPAALMILIVIASVGYGMWSLIQGSDSPGPTIALMHSRPREASATMASLPAPVDLMVWSELAYHPARTSAGVAERSSHITAVNSAARDWPLDVDSAVCAEDEMSKFCRALGTPIVMGYARKEAQGGGRYNSAAYVDPQRGVLGCYDKIALVPWTEFAPVTNLVASSASHFTHGRACPVFDLPSTNKQHEYKFAVTICYDVAFAGIFQQALHDSSGAPDFFVVCSSERSDRTGQMSLHALSMAKIRAIECGRTIVRNVRAGYSGQIDATGLLRSDALARSTDVASVGRIVIERRATFYSQFGDFVPWAVLVGVCATGLLQKRRVQHVAATAAS